MQVRLAVSNFSLSEHLHPAILSDLISISLQPNIFLKCSTVNEEVIEQVWSKPSIITLTVQFTSIVFVPVSVAIFASTLAIIVQEWHSVISLSRTLPEASGIENVSLVLFQVTVDTFFFIVVTGTATSVSITLRIASLITRIVNVADFFNASLLLYNRVVSERGGRNMAAHLPWCLR